MPAASMKQLLESGVHFGHQTRRWNPKMKPFIFTERGGIHIIDLQKTQRLLDEAYEFAQNIVERGGKVMFVGTKKQCQDIIQTEAERVDMPYVSHRWLGGLLTNFSTIHSRIRRLHELRRLKEDGSLEVLPTKERMNMERELDKLEINLGGVAGLDRLPDAVFVVDPKREEIATREVNKLGIPLIALLDTNCDPDEADYIIPGNDDAIRSCDLIIKTLVRGVEEARQKVGFEEMVAEEEEEAEAPAEKPKAEPEGVAVEEGEPKPSKPVRPRVSEAARRAAERKSPRAAKPKPGATAEPERVAPESGEVPGEPGGATEVVAPEQKDDAAERKIAEAGEPGTADQEMARKAQEVAEAQEAPSEAATAPDTDLGPESETAEPEQVTRAGEPDDGAPEEEKTEVEQAVEDAGGEQAVKEAATGEAGEEAGEEASPSEEER